MIGSSSVRIAQLMLIALLCPIGLGAQESVADPPLPPVLPWEGKSIDLIAADTDRWQTPAEKSRFQLSPSYDETVAWLRRLVAENRELQMVSIGRSGEGRDIWMVIASRERAFTPAQLRRSGKPTLMAQGGIHAGEIDGKDAGLMLLRDLGRGRRATGLLDGANLLFVPILNVDGHERSSRHSRVNQRGPEVSGWRTNARNLNLNRDYMKAQTPEVRAMIRLLREWQPELYLDLHVTDGADYQYDVTYAWNGRGGHSPAIAAWLEDRAEPALLRDLRAMGHVPGQMIWPADWNDLSRGNSIWLSQARYSNGYGDAAHIPALLVENHSLKPYRQRVLGTYVLLESMMRLLASDAAVLRQAIASDRSRRPERVPLGWVDPSTLPPTGSVEVLGVEAEISPSPISGGLRTRYTGRPVTMTIPLFAGVEATAEAKRPVAYWIPAAWREAIEILELHGVVMERLTEPRELEVEMYRLRDPRPAPAGPFNEGRPVVVTGISPEVRRERFPAGSVRVPTDQPRGTLAMLLLEPESDDSLFHWGFFLEVLQRTEYIEGYVLEPLAERMLNEDPELAAEFQRKLRDEPEFAASARERLNWFYRQTRYYDDRHLLYPVARER